MVCIKGLDKLVESYLLNIFDTDDFDKNKLQENLKVTSVSNFFNFSSRTLQRQLKTKDTSYRKILDSVRKPLALKYLRKNNVATTSLMLGYDDVSSFTKSFKKWYGIVPSKYKEII